VRHVLGDQLDFRAAKSAGQTLPSLHSPLFAPDREPTIKTGATVLAVSALELLANLERKADPFHPGAQGPALDVLRELSQKVLPRAARRTVGPRDGSGTREEVRFWDGQTHRA
jgi:hypothetical protein